MSIVTRDRWFRATRWRAASLVGLLCFAAVAAYALTARRLFSVRVVGVRPTGTQNRIEALDLRVTNTSGVPLRPAFDIVRAGYNSTFWLIGSGPRELQAHSSATYTILAPNFDAEPSTYGDFNVVGYVSKPQAFAVSPNYDPQLLGVILQPQAVDTPVKLGTPVDLEALIYDRSGRRIYRAGVGVRMYQLVWYSTGAIRAESRINGGRIGHYAYAETDARGVATFRVVGVRPQTYPVTFSATILNPEFHYYYGDSGNLNVRFVKR